MEVYGGRGRWRSMVGGVRCVVEGVWEEVKWVEEMRWVGQVSRLGQSR